ncbi:FIST signal transduction protein [Desulfopila aestuarii]|uniref:Uncharacterized conserved protein, contains FIST_N domain n=1 Tax=Desulfopila aestuarii DSM 18488 TaxID=1121416 RepID=A0A1M7XVM0_9BACT|nr:FIST N-terminal domain-containing protein [Desulfopila aestuarii]SHO42693.1 Uncharacterized conserved protein, contains FIST_N domain [Desulfopila aestuarii DSM 18488]
MKAFSAVSTETDSFEAGREVTRQVMKQVVDRPGMLWVFADIGYDQQQLLEGISSVAAGIPLIGCTTDGEISSSGLSEKSVVVLALTADTTQFHTAVTTSLSEDSYLAGVKIGEAFQHVNPRYLQIFSDGLTGNAMKIVEGIHSVLGKDVIIAGGTSGDRGFFSQTNQYHNGAVYTDSVVAVGITGDLSFSTGIGCGWFPVGTPKCVTKSEDNVVYELDGQPALQVYEKFLGKYASQLPAVGVEYPLGLLEPGEEEDEDYFLCRATMGVDRKANSIIFAGDVPQGAQVKMTMGNEDDVIGAARKAAEDAVTDWKKKYPDISPKVIFIYSCMARKIVLGSRIGEEIAEIRQIAGYEVPLIGFYTYGEYAPAGRQKQSCFLNETVTLTLLG